MRATATYLFTAFLLSTLTAPAITTDQIEALTLRSPLPVPDDLDAVCASGTTIVAGGKAGSTAISRDRGLTWNPGGRIPAPEGSSFASDVVDLATSGTLYVAATSNGLATSTEPFPNNRTQYTAPATHWLRTRHTLTQ